MRKFKLLNYFISEMIGLPLIHLDEVASTNDLAREWLETGKAGHGAVFTTEFQKAGKGRDNAIWESDRGKNLLLTLILESESFRVESRVELNIIISLSLHDLLNRYYRGRTKIKWPNDIFVDEGKIAGILIENSIQGKNIRSSIIGIGININQEKFEYENAVSMKLLDGQNHLKEEILFGLLDCIKHRLSSWKPGISANLHEEYERNMYKLNEQSRFMKNNAPFTGVIRGMDESGRLILDKENQLHYFENREIQMLSA